MVAQLDDVSGFGGIGYIEADLIIRPRAATCFHIIETHTSYHLLLGKSKFTIVEPCPPHTTSVLKLEKKVHANVSESFFRKMKLISLRQLSLMSLQKMEK